MIIPDLNGPQKNNQYNNLNAFARGGMGELYLADDIVNNKKVAIKLIHIINPAIESLLSRELDISIQLSGKNIVSTLYTNKIQISTDNFLYIVQEFYPNGNLRKRITPLIDLNLCFKMMMDLIEGLEIVHTKIVHRDLKPENILISPNDDLLIADFGLAKFVEDSTRSKTFKGGGTIPYMSPECWLNDKNSTAMDIYSLGIIFFEILTGKLPFDGKTEEEWRDFHLYSQLPDLTNFRFDIPVKLKQILSKMTQKRVSDRYNNINEFKDSLKQAQEDSNQKQMEVDRLASIAHKTIQQLSAEQLKKDLELKREDEFKKMLNFHITELFSRINQIVVNVNNKLEEQKINIEEYPYKGNLQNRRLTISFNKKSIYIEFPLHDEIEIYRQKNKKKNKPNQYGVLMEPPQEEDIFKKNNIIYFGSLRCNYQNPRLQTTFGFNLLLVKKDEEQYGKWFIASFSDSALAPGRNRKQFALHFDEFLKEFGLSFHLHLLQVEYRELQENDLIRAIEEIL